MLLMLGKNTLEINKFTENERLPNFELKFKLLKNFRKPLTLKGMRKCIDIAINGNPFKDKLARLTKIENVWFHSVIWWL